MSKKNINEWPGTDWPDLVGLPEPPPYFVKKCLESKEKGAGLLLAYLHKERLIFLRETQEWYIWDVLDPATGHGVWRLDYNSLAAEQAVESVALVFLREAAFINQKIKDHADDEDNAAGKRMATYRKALLRTIDTLRTVRGVRAALSFARSELMLSANKLDANPWLLVAQNATIELNHGAKSRPGRPDDYCTKCLNTEWRGVDFIDDLLNRVSFEIHNDNPAVDDYFWRWLGRAIVGDSILNEILLLFGPQGRNGKTIIIGCVSYVLGDYAGNIQSELLMESKFVRDANAPSPAILDLKGLRLAVAAETSEGQKAATSRWKLFSGGDEMIGRAVGGKHNIRFTPTHSLILMTNHKPRIPAADAAIWQRIRMIEYSRRFIANGTPDPALNEFPADINLASKLKERGPAILAKLVRGLLEALRDGLTPPQEVMASVAGYQKGEDLVRQRLDARCEFGEDYNIPARAGHRNFKVWYAEEISDTFSAPGPKKFSEELSRFLKKGRDNSNNHIYNGARLLPGFEQ